MWKEIDIALRTFLLPIGTLRAFRLGIVLFVLTVLLIGAAFSLGMLSSDLADAALTAMRYFIVFPGVPIGAVLFGEIPLRDGIRQRTLLYPLIGPVSRTTLAVVRTVATALLVGIGASLLVAFIRVLQQEGLRSLPGEVLAMLLGAFAYTSLFGLIHLRGRRGLIGGLALLGMIDEPLARVPFPIRNLAPSYHMRVVADREMEIQLPIVVNTTNSSIPLSALLLFALGVVFIALVAWSFRRKNLGELC